MISIQAQTRDLGKNLDLLRKEGFIPAVYYGRKEASTPISIDKKEFDKVFKQAGESTVITLKTPEGEHDALIHDVAHEALTGTVSHVDFYVIEKGKKVSVHVPVEFEGVSPAVKDLGGILVKALHEIEIEAMPKDLPHSLIVDISLITDFDKHVTAGDIKLPSGVELITDAEEIVAMVAKHKEEKEEDSAPIDLSSIEVEKKGKEAKEGEDAAE